PAAPSPLAIEAAIASVHAAAPDWAQTDWSALVALYDALAARTRSPAAIVNASVAQTAAGDPQGALARLDALNEAARAGVRAGYWAARATALQKLGNDAAASAARAEALRPPAVGKPGGGVSSPMRAHLEAQRRLYGDDDDEATA
ncbi:MAG: hypothetical protein AAGC56_00955, partial [Pseudomonadota bacterium]